MVSPLQLLLLGSRKVELLPDGLVRLDGWIKLKLDARVAALVAAMRPAISQLVKRCAGDPESLGEPGQREEQVVQVVRQLAKVNAGRWGMEEVVQTWTKRPHSGGDGGGPGWPGQGSSPSLEAEGGEGQGVDSEGQGVGVMVEEGEVTDGSKPPASPRKPSSLPPLQQNLKKGSESKNHHLLSATNEFKGGLFEVKQQIPLLRASFRWVDR